MLETFESFTSRFSRLSDIFGKQMLKSLILKEDPSFRGSQADLFNEAEKLDLISSAKRWWFVRSLRNKEAHEYTEEDLRAYFQAILVESKFIISEIKQSLNKI